MAVQIADFVPFMYFFHEMLVCGSEVCQCLGWDVDRECLSVKAICTTVDNSLGWKMESLVYM